MFTFPKDVNTETQSCLHWRFKETWNIINISCPLSNWSSHKRDKTYVWNPGLNSITYFFVYNWCSETHKMKHLGGNEQNIKSNVMSRRLLAKDRGNNMPTVKRKCGLSGLSDVVPQRRRTLLVFCLCSPPTVVIADCVLTIGIILSFMI